MRTRAIEEELPHLEIPERNVEVAGVGVGRPGKKPHNALSNHRHSPCWCFPLFEHRTWVQGSPEDGIGMGQSPGAESRA